MMSASSWSNFCSLRLRWDAAEDGEATLEALQNKNYHLLSTYQDMPKMSGIELAKRLHDAGMALPITMMSGKVPTEELKEHAWLQIRATLLKPHRINELLKTVKEVLGTEANETVFKKSAAW